MTSILRPRLVALDTSHWNGVVQDANSSDRDKRRRAHQFTERLADSGWIPLFAFHHLAEMMQHDNEELVDRRLRFLRELPLAAWIHSAEGTGVPGDIRVIQSVEVERAYVHADVCRLKVRDLARDVLIRFGTGRDAVPQSLDEWRILRTALADMQDHAQKVCAVSRWRPMQNGNVRLRELIKYNWRAPDEVPAVLARQQQVLAREIAERGDKRIMAPDSVAAEFMRTVVTSVATSHQTSDDPPVVHLLLASGFDREDIDLDGTFEAHMRKLVYLKQLRMLSEELALPWRVVKARVTVDRVPSAAIQEALREFSQDLDRRKGSDLNDMHLMCLASYADVTYVDKRTMENVRRARTKAPGLAVQLGAIYKAGHYTKILDDLQRLDHLQD